MKEGEVCFKFPPNLNLCTQGCGRPLLVKAMWLQSVSFGSFYRLFNEWAGRQCVLSRYKRYLESFPFLLWCRT